MTMSVNFFGRFLLRKGVITTEQLADAVDYQKEMNRRIGLIALDRGLLTQEQVQNILEEQKKKDLPFGEIAVRLKYLTRKKLDELLFLKNVNHVYLGEALLAKGYLSPEMHAALIREYLAVDAGREDIVRDILKDVSGGDVLSAVLHALETVFIRFVGHGIKVDPARDGIRESGCEAIFLLRAKVSGQPAVTCPVFVHKEAVRNITAAFSGFGGKEEFQTRTGREFFEIVSRYLHSSLAEKGFTVEQSSLEHCNAYSISDCGTSIHLILTTSSGRPAFLVSCNRSR